MANHGVFPQSSPSTYRIEIQPTTQHSHVDDWTGVTDPKVRRKLQNRLNQRAYRSRQETDGRGLKKRTIKEKSGPSRSLQVNDNFSATSTALSPASRAPPHSIGSQVLQWTWAPSNLLELMAFYECQAIGSYLGASPQADQLISLSRLNIWRAASDNIIAAGMTLEHLLADDSISTFSVSPADITKHTVPASLQPTALQRTVPHHPWFDVFPFPRMRDNFISGGDEFDEDDLCHDLIAFWDSDRTDATLLVWGQSWDPSNWEITEAFARKWSWTLKGCPELLKSTNRWRVRRGEKPLLWQNVLSLA